MPGPTLTEIVRKLGESVSTLFAVAEHAKENLGRVEAAHERTVNAVQEMTTKLGGVEDRLNELKKVTEEGGRRKFSLWQGILCAVLGSLLTILGQIGIAYLRVLLGVP